MRTRNILLTLIPIGLLCLTAALIFTSSFVESHFSYYFQIIQFNSIEVDRFRLNLASMGLFLLLSASGAYVLRDSPAWFKAKLDELPLRTIFFWTIILFCSFAVLSNYLVFNPPKMTEDSAVFEHAGWYITQGAKPYLDIWDPKPPLVFETTLLLAFLAQGNMVLMHLFSVLLCSGALAGILILTESISYKLTNNRLASVLGTLVLLTVPGFYTLASLGFHPKYLMIFCALAAIDLQIKHRRPLLSGALLAASTMFWLPGIVFLLFGLGLSFFNSGHKALKSTLMGIIITGLIILVPVMIWDVFQPMLIEVVFVPFTVKETQTALDRIIQLSTYLGVWGLPSILIGVFGFFIPLFNSQGLRTTWWIPAGGVWFGAQLLLVDYDSYPDIFVVLLFCALGMSFFLNWIILQKKSSLMLIMASLLIMIPVLFKGINWGFQEIVYKPGRISLLAEEERPPGFDEAPEMVRIFWNKEIPPGCHYRLSRMEIQWMEKTGQTGTEQVCGQMDIFDLIQNRKNP